MLYTVHPEEGTIDMMNKKCLFEQCNNDQHSCLNGNKPLLCSIHREGGMIDIIIKKCLLKECDKTPAFSLEWEKWFDLLRSSIRGYDLCY